MCSKEILKLNKICSSTLSGDDVFLAPSFFCGEKIHQIFRSAKWGDTRIGHDYDSFLAVAFTFGGGCGFHDLGRES